MRTLEEIIKLVSNKIDYIAYNPTSRRCITITGKPGFYSKISNTTCAVAEMFINAVGVASIYGTSILIIKKICDENRIDFNSLFKPECRGYPVDVLAKLEQFHDENDNWDAAGLSATGEARKNQLLSDIQSMYKHRFETTSIAA